MSFNDCHAIRFAGAEGDGQLGGLIFQGTHFMPFRQIAALDSQQTPAPINTGPKYVLLSLA